MSLTRRELFGALAAAPLAGAAATRPNVIVILMDDLGYGQFGPNSDTFTLDQLNPFIADRDKKETTPEAALAAAKRATPNMTRLAAEGTRFTDAYVTSPLCAPSRSALLTARYPERFGVYVNTDVTRVGVPTDQLFLPQLLQKSGYATAAIGKWHVARMAGGMKKGLGQHPLERGFDYFFGFNSHGTEYYGSKILERNYEPAAAEGYTTDQFTEEALGFLRRSKDRPFFLYLPYNAVHGPYGRLAPEVYLKRFDTGSRRIDNFYAYLAAADDGLGRIRKLLEEQGRARDTLIVLMSDNGASGNTPMPSNGPFPGFKGQVWQGGLRVPMAMWGPGIPAGKICREPVISLDVLPTALAATGVGLPAGYRVDGRSVLPLLQGTQNGPLHDGLFWAGELAQKWTGGANAPDDELTAPPAWAARQGRWLLRYWSHLGRLELYDMETDKGERHDVAGEHPDVVRRLRTAYAAWYGQTAKPVAWPEASWKKVAP